MLHNIEISERGNEFKVNDNQERAVLRNGEMGLAELLHELWAQKILILASVGCALMIAIGYCALVKPVYASQVTLSPASISNYGSIAGEFEQNAYQSSKSPLHFGVALSNDAFQLFLSNVESMKTRNEFHERGIGYGADVVIQVKKGRSTQFIDEPTVISVRSTSSDVATNYLNALVDYSSGITVSQLNEYLKGIGVSQNVTAAALFQVEESIAAIDQPVKPNKPIILLLGVVLGAVFGVFSVLVVMFFKRA